MKYLLARVILEGMEDLSEGMAALLWVLAQYSHHGCIRLSIFSRFMRFSLKQVIRLDYDAQ